MVSDKIKTKQATIWVDEEGICRVVLDAQAELGLEDLKELVEIQFELLRDKKAPLLVDMRDIKSSSRESREYSAKVDRRSVLLAMALVERSVVGKMLGNAFINFQKPRLPTRLFNSEEKAVAWLRGFLED